MWICALLLLFVLEDPADGWQVQLANGASYHADSAQRDGETWLLSVAGGTIRVRASEVTSIERASADGHGPVNEAPVTESEPTPVEKIESSRHRFVIDGTSFSVELPSGYGRAPDDDLVTFVHDDNMHSVRFGQAAVEESIWQLGPAIKRHHKESYSHYRTRSERFTRLASYPAWLLRFSYRKGDETWMECQGFLVVNDRVIVVSVSSPASDGSRSEYLVRSIGRSMSTADQKDDR